MTLLDIARRRPVWWYVGTLVLAAVLRMPMLPVQSLDFHRFLTFWWTAAGADPANALTGNVHNYDYTPVYIAIMVVVHPLLGGMAPVIAIKLISIAGDIVCAVVVRGIVTHFRPDPAYGRAVFTIVLILPTVMLDSSAFAQVDSLYTAVLLAGILAVLRDRQGWAMTAFGLALAFKFQAVFLAPAVGALLLIGVIRWRYIWCTVVAMLAAFAPAVIAGRSPLGVLGTYGNQAGEYPFLTLNAPSIYAWSQNPPPGSFPVQGSFTDAQANPDAMTAVFPRVGHDTITLLTACAVLPCALLGLHVWRRRRRLVALPNQEWIVLLCAVSAMLVPFVLPSMHERYFYPSDLLVLTLAFIVPTKAVRRAAVLALSASTLSYALGWFVYHGHVLPLGIPGLAMAAALFLLVRELRRVSRPAVSAGPYVGRHVGRAPRDSAGHPGVPSYVGS